MSRLHEISCRNCGSSISLSEEWDRTPNDFRPQDRVLRRCLMCGGEMQFFKRWIDPPAMHPECSDERWSEIPCSMCFGPMTVKSDGHTARRYHDRCRPEFWYERSCDICQEPMRVHVDWENPPSRHRGCETDEWYEKGCKYCGTTLKVHVSWQHAPAAHRECEPLHDIDQPLADPGPDADAEKIEHVPDPNFASSDAFATDVHELDVRSFNIPIDDASQNAGVAEDLTPSEITVDDELADPVFTDEPSCFASENESGLPEPNDAVPAEDLAPECDDDVFINGHDLQGHDIAAAEQEIVAAPTSEIDDAEGVSDEDSLGPPAAPDFLFLEAEAPESLENNCLAGSAVFHIDGDEITAPVDEARHAGEDDPLEPVTRDECSIREDAEANETPSEHERFCTRCGKHLSRIDAFHLSSNAARDADGICRDCEHDLMLVGGAVAALRKQMAFDLRSVSELRTVTFPVTVVTNAETGELVAEVMLMDDGIFSPDRVAVAYDPITEQRLSKTVFGHKGLFSSLRTAETYDREGNLLHHARHGGELALAAGAEGIGERPVQVEKNRFFFRKR